MPAESIQHQHMNQASRSNQPRRLFRARALHYNTRVSERAVLPHSIRPLVFAWFWLLLILIALVALVIVQCQEPLWQYIIAQ